MKAFLLNSPAEISDRQTRSGPYPRIPSSSDHTQREARRRSHSNARRYVTEFLFSWAQGSCCIDFVGTLLKQRANRSMFCVLRNSHVERKGHAEKQQRQNHTEWNLLDAAGSEG